MYKVNFPKKFIAFVCVGNACRSQMAEAWARHLGGEKWEVFSAGSRPTGFVVPEVHEVMAEVGINTSFHRSKGVRDLPDRTWDWVISMGCGDACLVLPAKNRLDWPIPDPYGEGVESFRRVRDDLEKRIRNLFAQMEGSDSG